MEKFNRRFNGNFLHAVMLISHGSSYTLRMTRRQNLTSPPNLRLPPMKRPNFTRRIGARGEACR